MKILLVPGLGLTPVGAHPARRTLADSRRRKADPHEAARPPNTPGGVLRRDRARGIAYLVAGSANVAAWLGPATRHELRSPRAQLLRAARHGFAVAQTNPGRGHARSRLPFRETPNRRLPPSGV